MDLNFWVDNGISYMNKQKEEIFMEREKRRIRSKPIKKEDYNIYDSEFLKTQYNRIKEWQKNNIQTTTNEPLFICSKRMKHLKLVMDNFSKNDEFKLLLFKMTNNEQNYRCVKITSYQNLEEKKQSIDDALTTKVGISKIIQLLGGYNKPIVGHNCFMDFVFLFQKCINPLPDTVKSFKNQLITFFGKNAFVENEEVNENDEFPIIFDTKILCHQNDEVKRIISKNTSLVGLFDLTKTWYDIHELWEEKELTHHAGYDAYMTGVVFINLIRKLMLLKRENPIFRQPKENLKFTDIFKSIQLVPETDFNVVNPSKNIFFSTKMYKYKNYLRDDKTDVVGWKKRNEKNNVFLICGITNQNVRDMCVIFGFYGSYARYEYINKKHCTIQIIDMSDTLTPQEIINKIMEENFKDGINVISYKDAKDYLSKLLITRFTNI